VSLGITIEQRFQASEIIAAMRRERTMREIAQYLDLPLAYCFCAHSMYNRTRFRHPDQKPYPDRYLCPEWAIRQILAFGGKTNDAEKDRGRSPG
jgi:hypothetical protein